MRRSLRLTASLTLALSSISAGAGAHISLDSPKARYWDPQRMEAGSGSPQKQAPCGMSGDKRTTNTALITTFKPGEQITVKWHETIGHPGHYRIAFLESGQNFPAGTMTAAASPAPPILLDGIQDDASKTNGTYSVQVTLPNVECNNCTLQLIQVMTDSGGYYYQCADLVLSNSATGSGGAGNAGSSSGGASGGGMSVAGRGGGSGGLPSMNGGTGGARASGGASGAPSSGGNLALGETGGASGGQSLVAGGAPPVAGSSNLPPPLSAGTGGSGGSVAMSASAGTVAAAGTPAQTATEAEDEGGCSVRGSGRAHGPATLLGAAALAWALARQRRKPRRR